MAHAPSRYTYDRSRVTGDLARCLAKATYRGGGNPGAPHAVEVRPPTHLVVRDVYGNERTIPTALMMPYVCHLQTMRRGSTFVLGGVEVVVLRTIGGDW